MHLLATRKCPNLPPDLKLQLPSPTPAAGAHHRQAPRTQGQRGVWPEAPVLRGSPGPLTGPEEKGCALRNTTNGPEPFRGSLG